MSDQIRYQTIAEWETVDGEVRAYNEAGDEIIEIEALQNPDQCAKWGEKYVPGRAWRVTREDGTTVSGRGKDLRVAKKAAILALNPIND